MNLALVLGANSESIKSKLMYKRDNLKIECFSDLEQFIKQSISCELEHDRIIILSTLLEEDSDDLDDLYNYWDTYNRGSEIVYLCKKDSGDDLARKFLTKFCSTNVSSMSVTSTTLHTLSDAVTLPISQIITDYGIKDYMAVEVEDDSYFKPEVEEDEEVNSVNQDIDSTEKVTNEKRSLFGVLFGKKGRGKNREQTQNSNTNIHVNNTKITIEDNESVEEPQEQIFSSQDYVEEDNFSNDCFEQSTEYNNYDNGDESDNIGYSYEIHDDNSNTLSSDNSDNFKDDFYTNENDTSENNCVDYDCLYETKDNVLEDNYDLTDVDDDFGDLSYVDDPINNHVLEKSGGIDVHTEEVEDFGGDLSVGSAEEEYRQKTEQPKIIKETVVKEVIKSVKTSSVLENINKGIVHKAIIVTGDRGSGVTTTAWSLALYFANKVPVLYFDCDVENHGLMNYIDYFDFKNYEDSHMNGVKLCKSSQAFNSCVCKFGTNLDILTTDFGVDVTDDELILSQGIVAENLHKYGVVIVDCPISKLHCVQDLIMTSSIALCIEESKRGYMNALMLLDKSELSLRYKRSMLGKGTILRTKVKRDNDYKRIISYINNIVDFEDCNWLNMPSMEFNGKVTNNLLTQILEG